MCAWVFNLRVKSGPHLACFAEEDARGQRAGRRPLLRGSRAMRWAYWPLLGCHAPWRAPLRLLHLLRLLCRQKLDCMRGGRPGLLLKRGC
jgi:hypothetical protein